MKNIARLFIASWYLLGWISHVYLAIAAGSGFFFFSEAGSRVDLILG
jgi:hypothetical protein